MRLCGRLVKVGDLTVDDRRQMLELMQRHYVNVLPAVFEADLAEKQWVIKLVDSTGEICGFSTQMILDVDIAGRSIKALFSGDTIIDPRYWGNQELTHVWGNLALSLVDRFPGGDELYWFLLSGSYRTYRFLRVFFHEFYPRYDQVTPRAMQQVIDALANHKFAARYDASLGLIRVNEEIYRLSDKLAHVGEGRLGDPHVKFFLERNPDYAQGDELCCVAPITRENFTEAAYRVIQRNRGPTRRTP